MRLYWGQYAKSRRAANRNLYCNGYSPIVHNYSYSGFFPLPFAQPKLRLALAFSGQQGIAEGKPTGVGVKLFCCCCCAHSNMSTKTILLVEDNSDDQELALLAFERSKVAPEVVIVPDGEQALDYLFGTGAFADRDLTKMPALVLLDLKLPKMDGLEVLRRLRTNPRTQLIPVVILTTSREQQDLINSYSVGCNGYICKPVDFKRFQKAMQKLASYWLEFNEAPPVIGT